MKKNWKERFMSNLMTPGFATQRPLKGLPGATLPLCAHFVHYS